MTEPPASSPTSQLSFVDASRRHDRQRALRALLMRPLLSVTGPGADDCARVRLHAAWIRSFLQRNTGWRLDVDAEVARLRKVPVDGADATRPARDHRGVPFPRRRYVLLCLALAALERCDRQTTLGQLAEGIVGCFADDPGLAAAGITLDLAVHEHRKDLVAAIRYLLDLQALVRVQGDEDQFVAARGDVLYNVQRAVLTRVPGFLRGPSTLAADGFEDRLAALLDEPAPTYEDARNRRIRHRLVRRLLDDPVVLLDGLDPDERAYFIRQRAFLAAEVHEATGLVPEVRREGIAMVDDRSELSDVSLPEDGTEGHITLLLAGFLAAWARRAPGRPAPLDALHGHITSLAATYGRYWRADAREPGAEASLARRALERLAALRLVDVGPGGVTPLAPIGRYALAGTEETHAPPPRPLARARRAKRGER